MKRILSTVLALMMVCACAPFSVLAADATETGTNLLIGEDATLELGNQNILKNASDANLQSVNNIGRELEEVDISMEYTAEQLRAMSTEELVKNTESTLNRGFSEKYADRSDEYGELTDPNKSDKEFVQRIMANKAEAKAEAKASLAHGAKLAQKRANEKYVVVDNTILITNEDELRGIAGQEGYFRLAADIKLTQPWEPIDFYGTLEGAGYTISAATMEYGEYDYVGFFSTLGATAYVRNLNFDYPYVYANANAGAICAYNQGIIENCHVVSGTVIGYLWASFEEAFWTISGYNMGGIAGVNEGYIMNCSYEGDVDGWKEVGGICGLNAGFVYGCFVNGNIAYETNQIDIDYYGAEYTYYTYGEAYYLPFSTMLRDMWAAYMLLEYEYTAYGYNGGLVGENYYAVFDSCVQGAGSGSSYDVGVVGGFDCMGGLVGGDAGWTSHCYSIDRAFPVFADGAEVYCAWDYGDAGQGLYYDHAYFLAHKGIALNVGDTAASDQLYFYGTQGLPCEDGAYHGEELTADQFYAASTFSQWNHGEWNTGEVWIIEDGYIPTLAEVLVIPEEFVIRYEVANAGGLLDGDVVAYKLAHHDDSYNYTEPAPPVASATISGYGIVGWHPETPEAGKAIFGDKVYKAYFGEGGTTGDGSGSGNGSGGFGDNDGPGGNHIPGGDGGGTNIGPDIGVNNLIGDTNLDGTVNTADATYLLKAIAENKVSELSSDAATNADTNSDESINTADATRILQYCAGVITKF
ncbi:MAG: dockerin type I repeat-containing protein [Clostridia bacterium]|nr:dockerin type I repeat-containing protein [Clostridia bacterium]